MYDYDYSNETFNTSDASGGFLAGIGLGFILVYFAVLIFMLVALWKLFTKAGKPGWAGIIPIYNLFVALEIVGRPVWWLALMFVPLVNVVVSIIVANDMAKSFGKGTGWTVGLILLPIIFYPILAFGSAKYVGPSVKAV